MVAFLEKPNESAGIEQIIDFMNASSIKYALTVNPTIYALCIQQFWDTTKVKTMNEIVQIQALVDKKKVVVIEASVRCYLQLDNFEGQEEVGKGSANPNDPHHTLTNSQTLTSQPQKKQKSRKSKIKIIEVPHPSNSTANVPNKEHVLTPSNEPPLSGEDRMKLTKLIDLCTKLTDRVLALETTKTTQALEITSLKIRVKKLKKRVSRELINSRGLYTWENDNLIFDTSVFDSEEVVNTAEKEVSTTDLVTTAGEVVTTVTLSITTTDIKVSIAVVITSIPNTSTIVTTVITPEEINLAQEITLAQALATLKSIKPMVKDVVSPTIATTTIATTTIDTRPKPRGVVVQEPSEFSLRLLALQSSQLPQAKDKGKAIMVEPEVPLKMKDQIRLDEELARKLEAEEQEVARLESEEAERQEQANIDLINSS
ncbi:hypothetical protein Tco_1469009, partial [Tanacetum coccineum]